MYQVLDALLIRASAYPADLALSPWPDPTGDAHVLHDWLEKVWADEFIAAAITAASPTLSHQVERIRAGHCLDARQLHRASASVMRYLLRMTGRSTPFALFAGVAPATLDAEPSVSWGRSHRYLSRPGGAWLAAVATTLEGCPALLRRLPVMANDLAEVRGDHVVVPCQSFPGQEGRHDAAPITVDVSVRHTPVVAAIMTYTRRPIAVDDLLDKLHSDFPTGATSAAEAAIARLVRTRVLLTALRPPMTVTDGLAYLLAQLAAVDAETLPEVTDQVRSLRTIADGLRDWRYIEGCRQPWHRSVVEEMKAMHTGAEHPIAVDLRVDATVTLPETLRRHARHARDAATALTRLTPYPQGLPAWLDYHAVFLERYGVGAVVPLLDVVNPDVGLGLPATFRGSDRTVVGAPLSERDRALLRLVQQTTIGGREEIALDDRMIAQLTGSTHSLAQVPPHIELFLQVHADSMAALHEDRYTLFVTGAARAAGSTTGRFLHLLHGSEQDRFRNAYSSVATVRTGAVPTQLSFTPIRAASNHLACAPPILSVVLSAGALVDGDAVIRLEDLAVGGDTDGLFLVSLHDRRVVEPTVFNAVEFRFFSHPLARFLCELPRASAATYMPFSWGAAASLPFLPRLRYGRTVLAPARWNLTAADLPPTGSDWNAWRAALARWRQRFRLPDLVYLVEADNLLPLDLAENAHQELLRAHLNRHGYARLDEAPPPGVFGWLDGHAHEIAIPLTSTVPGRKTPHLARVRMIESGDGHLPGTAPWLYAKLYTSPGRLIELLGQVPDLIADWDEVTEWWYLPYRDPDPHVRLRIRLPDVDAYGSATVRVGDWVARLRRHRLVGRLQLDTYHPETGRYGHGQAMTAAEQVFAADSAAALAELRAAAANAAPLDAFAAASLVAIVLSFIGDTDRGFEWLVAQLPRESEPTDRAVHATTMRLADPTDDWSHLRAVDRAGTVMNAWRQRRAALAAYRDQLTPQCDPLTVLPSLLHLHSIRLHGVDPDRERLARRLARAAAMRWSALRPGKTG